MQKKTGVQQILKQDYRIPTGGKIRMSKDEKFRRQKKGQLGNQKTLRPEITKGQEDLLIRKSEDQDQKTTFSDDNKFV